MPPLVKAQTPTGERKTGGNVLDRIAPLAPAGDIFSCAIYGHSGTGKTRLWSTFPGPILAMICSGGIRSGEGSSILAQHRKKIQTVQLEHPSEFKDIINFVERANKFKTIVLDHASGFADLDLRDILGLKEIPAQKSWGMATQQQYGTNTLHCKESWRAMLNLPINRVFVAHERNFGEDNPAELIKPVVGASLSPKLAHWLHGACEHVFQTYIRNKTVEHVTEVGEEKIVSKEKVEGEVEFCLRIGPHESYIAKIREAGTAKLPSVIVDPSYDKIVKVIRGEPL